MGTKKTAIRRWMRLHVEEHVDECDEVDCTGLVEAWDREEADGEQTLDPDHVAWDVAVEVSEEHERGGRR